MFQRSLHMRRIYKHCRICEDLCVLSICHYLQKPLRNTHSESHWWSECACGFYTKFSNGILFHKIHIWKVSHLCERGSVVANHFSSRNHGRRFRICALYPSCGGACVCSYSFHCCLSVYRRQCIYNMCLFDTQNFHFLFEVLFFLLRCLLVIFLYLMVEFLRHQNEHRHDLDGKINITNTHINHRAEKHRSTTKALQQTKNFAKKGKKLPNNLLISSITGAIN